MSVRFTYSFLVNQNVSEIIYRDVIERRVAPDRTYQTLQRRFANSLGFRRHAKYAQRIRHENMYSVVRAIPFASIRDRQSDHRAVLANRYCPVTLQLREPG